MVVAERILVELSAVAVCSLLVYSGASKLVAGSAVRATLAEIGVPRQLLEAARLALGMGELGLGLLTPLIRDVVVAALVAALGSGFAAVGAWAIASRQNVDCACFGFARKRRTLGWRQVVHLPLWIIAAIVLASGASQEASLTLRLTSVSMGLLVSYGLAARHLWQVHRLFRNQLSEV